MRRSKLNEWVDVHTRLDRTATSARVNASEKALPLLSKPRPAPLSIGHPLAWSHQAWQGQEPTLGCPRLGAHLR